MGQAWNGSLVDLHAVVHQFDTIAGLWPWAFVLLVLAVCFLALGR